MKNVSRCCVCGAVNPPYLTQMGRVGQRHTWHARYYCEACWRVLVAWLSGQVALAQAVGTEPKEQEEESA